MKTRRGQKNKTEVKLTLTLTKQINLIATKESSPNFASNIKRIKAN